MKERCKAVIFDLDGVIANTAQYHERAWIDLVQELGYEDRLEAGVYDYTRGVDRLASLEYILQAIGLTSLSMDEKLRLTDRKNFFYQRYIQALTPSSILPGVPQLLQVLKANAIPVALGSASRNGPIVLDRLGIAEYFNAIADPATVPSKPAPDLFLQGAVRMGVEPSACIVVEDAISGIEAASRAGMQSLFVGPAHLRHQCSPTWVLPSLEDPTVLYEALGFGRAESMASTVIQE